MTHTQSNYLFLCACVNPAPTPTEVAALRKKMDSDSVDWDDVVRIADREWLGPVLYRSLVTKDLLDGVPKDISRSLKRRFVLNTVLNERTKTDIAEAVAVLNRAGIEPLLLKGGLHLFEAATVDLGTRMMADIDVLVPEDRLMDAVEALRAVGYREDEEDEAWTYHYRPMSRPGSTRPIELHRYVGEQTELLPVEEVWNEAVPVPAEGLQMRALCPSHRVFHNIFHSQIQDRGHELGMIYLRQLRDLADVCARHATAIDWAAVRARADKYDLVPQLRARLYQAAQLFGLSIPGELSPTLGARFHHRRCLVQLRSDRLMAAVLTWAGATHPFKRHAINLIYGSTTGPLELNAYRLRHAWYLIRRHRGRILSKIGEKRRLLK